MKILAIDPGNKLSAYVLMDEYKPIEFIKTDNEDVIGMIDLILCEYPDCQVAIEMVASYGLAVGKDVFETCVYIGRIIQRIKDRHPDIKYKFIYRKDVKMNICHQMTKVNDTTIRHALVDRFAEHDFKTGKGTKKNPDFFYGFSADVWSAYAVGVTYLDKSISPKD
jgi:hypothetical protein